MSKIAVDPAKIVSQKTHQISGKLSVTEHTFSVPKDFSQPQKGTIQLFARSVKKHETPILPPSPSASSEKDQIPWLVFLNGGPGLPCRPPQHYAFTQRVLEAGYQLLFLDQRGTGLSTPVTASTLQMRGYEDVQAQYLKFYRADSIVRDCEAIRKALTDGWKEEERRKWSIMGQSFGGFCAVTYLSFYPEGLRECFLFGGLQPLVKSPDEVYKRLYVKCAERNRAYYTKYPEDIQRVKIIMRYLSRFGDGKIKLPSEGNLTRRRFQQIGIALGFHGGLDSVHDIVLRGAYDIEAFGHLTRGTLSAIDSMSAFDDHLLYAIMHEPIYCEGQAPNWSAHRMQQNFPEFSLERNDSTSDEKPVYFTGEMIFPWMFEDYTELRKVQNVANRVAEDSDWPALFDEEQLARNEVPVYAAGYIEDMYVDTTFAMETARKIRGCKVFETNVLFHDAIRSKMDEVLRQAFALRDDVHD